MLINLGLKTLARCLAANWFGLVSQKRRTAKRDGLRLAVEGLESRRLLTQYTVTTALDDTTNQSVLSLRDAINDANANSGADTIVFAPGLSGQRLLLTQGTLLITDPVTITGLGATNTVIDAQLNSRVFELSNSAGDVTFDSLTITAGKTTLNSARGAGIYSQSLGTVTLTNSTVTANTTIGAFAQGAGIFSFAGPVNLFDSTVSLNTTTGGTAPGGGIATNTGSITLVNSTISGNVTRGVSSGGGGIATYAGDLKLINTTVTVNATAGSSSQGGGIFSGATAAQHTSTVTINNSIVANNTSTGSTAADISMNTGVTTFNVNNSIIGVNTGTNLTAAPLGSPDAGGNLIGTNALPIDPKLGPLALNGGQTKTHALLAGSPAINSGDNSLAVTADNVALTLDQAGNNRIFHTTVDMGSLELQSTPTPPTVSFSGASQSVNESAGTITLTVNLSAATSSNVTIPFTLSGTAANPADYSISASPLTIAAGSTSGTIQITIVDDSIAEGNETIVVSMGTPTNATLGSTTTDTVTILDNDNGAPTDITLSSNTVAENVANAVVGTLTAVDPNDNGAHTFSIQSGGQGSQFVISGNQLEVGSTGLNYEALSGGVATVTIRATDSTNLFVDKTFNITVTDVNETPTIASGQVLSIAGNSANGTVVGTVSAADPDTTAPNNTLTYSITSGNTSGAFAINASTGQLTVANQAALNPATNPTFTLQIKVADGGSPSLSATQNVTVNVSGSGTNTAPSIPSGQLLTTAEARAAGSVVGTVVATDSDSSAPNNTLTYSIIGGNTGNAFAINSSNGQITINTPSAVDFESNPQFNLQIKVADGGSPSLSATNTVTINVTDVNEAPVISSGQTFGVAQNAPVNTVVGTISASDPDTSAPNNTLTYSIVGGNTNNAFAINSTTGQITVSNSAALNPAVTPQFALQVRAADGGSPSLSTTQTVTINVSAVNQAPSIPSGQGFSVNENSSANTVVGTVIASDPDTTAPNKTLTYSITGGNTNSAFAINSATGQLTVNNAAALNFETTPQFTLQIQVADGGTPSLSATNSVTVNLIDVNEAPTIPGGQSFSIAEHSSNSTVVGTVTANDPDTTAPNKTLTYSIISGNTGGAFGINSSTGQITVANSSALNFATTP
ncbi:MAG: Cadherin domain protein, partial [Planctomycetaceae bacterium]|nr:Cadherin domain protein [Planctomycetaceae bacterium]